MHTCQRCGISFEGRKERKYCTMTCAAYMRHQLGQFKPKVRTRPDEDKRVKRHHRERVAPGLTANERTDLLHDWRKAGRRCTYCGAACETVDHIVPLVRGGTNYEGNLTPCCRRCNGSKGGRTILEWKHRRPAAQFTDTRPWMVDLPPVATKATRAKQVKSAPLEHPCKMCGTPTTRRKHCSDACMSEWNARATRERYRTRVGLPSTWDRPSIARAA